MFLLNLRHYFGYWLIFLPPFKCPCPLILFYANSNPLANSLNTHALDNHGHPHCSVVVLAIYVVKVSLVVFQLYVAYTAIKHFICFFALQFLPKSFGGRVDLLTSINLWL